MNGPWQSLLARLLPSLPRDWPCHPAAPYCIWFRLQALLLLVQVAGLTAFGSGCRPVRSQL